METLHSHYDTVLVAVSIVVAALASLLALDLAARVRDRDRAVALWWGLGGSIAMGTGIWAMHFIGMMAFTLPIVLGYTEALTALSWVAAVAVSGVALAIAGSGALTRRRLAGGSVTMGLGICAMHYLGMEALAMAPSIVWDLLLVGASALIAVAASAAALTLFELLLRVRGARRTAGRVAAAIVMGLAISGMHYTGMAAASFPVGSVCGGASDLQGAELGRMVIGGTVALLVLTIVTSALDGRLRGRSLKLSDSLQQANAELTAANASLRALALRDSLTGLANRSHFEDQLRQAVAEADDCSVAQPLAVLFIDLDGFKLVNDSAGHGMGDALLRAVAERLLAAVGDRATVARVGGDQFVALVHAAGSAEGCIDIGNRLVEILGTPYRVQGQLLSLSASVGVAIHPADGNGSKLLAYADAAMYAAKRSGGGCCRRFEPHMEANAQEQLTLQMELRCAIERGQLFLHYQPKIDARSGAVAGVEALLRWRHPQRGLVSPAIFIPIAERFGLINALGDWVIDEACRQLAAWSAAGMPQKMAINVSVHQLRHGNLPARVAEALRLHGVQGSDLLCEITESAAMEDLHASRGVFDELAAMGVYLSIDDFGTGHSSLSYLRSLPARQLKIDRSFVNDIEASADARAVVHAILSLAHALHLRVVAEGVETAGQRQVLEDLGCDELQGYLLGRPMDAQRYAAWFSEPAHA